MVHRVEVESANEAAFGRPRNLVDNEGSERHVVATELDSVERSHGEGAGAYVESRLPR